MTFEIYLLYFKWDLLTNHLLTNHEIIFSAEVPKLCRMEADGGPCRSYLRRYAFNLSSMRCEEFIYGGCYGNGNNFRDLQSCVDHCLPERS
uniref:BPTI/Kunitz inhibitor domain-containing protein n=1 Tax=Zosterops lateralis melanops TaxID=1220523 RepID=A0A8D2PZK0_ZOSLA